MFLREGQKIGDPCAFFANPLGSLCALVLRDKNHVLLNRSNRVAEGEGLLTCVGGHPEPSHIGIRRYSDVDPSAVTDELFGCMKREIFEETNLPPERLSEMYMLGVASCMKTHGRQALLFCCFADLNTKEVYDCYKQGPTDQYESLGIQFLSLDNIVELINRSPEKVVPETRALYTVLTEQYDCFKAHQMRCFT